jgi:hypothetical protein
MNTDQPARSRGRYRAYQQPARRHAVRVRLTAEEKDLIDDAAAAAGLTPTGYTAKAAVEAATSGRAPLGEAGDLRELQHELFAARRAVNMLGANVHRAAAAYSTTGTLPSWVDDAARLCAAAVTRLDAILRRVDRRLR